MQNENRPMPLPVYYLLTASLINLVYVMLGTLVFILLSPKPKVDSILIVIIIFVLLQKSLIIGWVTYSAQKQAKVDKVSGTKFIGFYFGRFFGLFFGAFLGYQIAKGIGAIIGAVCFYLIGRPVGAKLGFFIGQLLDKNLPVVDSQEQVIASTSPSKKIFASVYIAFFPWLMVFLALFFKYNDIQIGNPYIDLLPIARIVVIALTLISLVIPWLIQGHIPQNQTPNSIFNAFWLGLGFSAAPVIYGFFLFTMGASILELGVFAVISSLAAIIWSIKTSV